MSATDGFITGQDLQNIFIKIRDKIWVPQPQPVLSNLQILSKAASESVDTLKAGGSLLIDIAKQPVNALSGGLKMAKGLGQFGLSAGSLASGSPLQSLRYAKDGVSDLFSGGLQALGSTLGMAATIGVPYALYRYLKRNKQDDEVYQRYIQQKRKRQQSIKSNKKKIQKKNKKKNQQDQQQDQQDIQQNNQQDGSYLSLKNLRSKLNEQNIDNAFQKTLITGKRVLGDTANLIGKGLELGANIGTDILQTGYDVASAFLPPGFSKVAQLGRRAYQKRKNTKLRRMQEQRAMKQNQQRKKNGQLLMIQNKKQPSPHQIKYNQYKNF